MQKKRLERSGRMSGGGEDGAPKRKQNLNDFFAKESQEQRDRRLQTHLSLSDAIDQQQAIASLRAARHQREFRDAFQLVRAGDAARKTDTVDDAAVLAPFQRGRGIFKTFEKKTTYTSEFSKSIIFHLFFLPNCFPLYCRGCRGPPLFQIRQLSSESQQRVGF
jgi:hypothetical protein